MKVSSQNNQIELVKHNNIYVSDPAKGIEIIQRDAETLWIVTPNKVHTFRCLHIDRGTKEITLLHKGNKHTLKISEPIDEILASMGLQDALTPKIDWVKAPMPGLVLDIKVQPGDTIKKGDTLLILEAMKMENAIKSPIDATVKSVEVAPQQAVDKNAILVHFQ